MAPKIRPTKNKIPSPSKLSSERKRVEELIPAIPDSDSQSASTEALSKTKANSSHAKEDPGATDGAKTRSLTEMDYGEATSEGNIPKDAEMLKRHSVNLIGGHLVALVPSMVGDGSEAHKEDVEASVRKSSRLAKGGSTKTSGPQPPVVTLDGDETPDQNPLDEQIPPQMPTASPQSNPDLDWLLTTYGGTLGYQFKQVKDVVLRVVDRLDELTTRVGQLEDTMHIVKLDIFRNTRHLSEHTD